MTWRSVDGNAVLAASAAPMLVGEANLQSAHLKMVNVEIGLLPKSREEERLTQPEGDPIDTL